jgi:mRNA interferase MazF
MKRGEVYFAELEPRSGSEQRGKRPVIIISNDGFNETQGWRSIIVVPVSSSPKQALRGPTVVNAPKGAGGLSQDSVILCHQITTLDKSKLIQKLGDLAEEIMVEIAAALKAAMDLD